MSHLISRKKVTIRSGTSTSGMYVIDGKPPTVLEMSGAWTAAPLSFAGSGDLSNYLYIYKEDGLILTIPTDVNYRINLPVDYLSDHLSIMVCSGVPGAIVNQGGDRDLYLEVWE
jgi:hypothetical protein